MIKEIYLIKITAVKELQSLNKTICNKKEDEGLSEIYFI